MPRGAFQTLVDYLMWIAGGAQGDAPHSLGDLIRAGGEIGGWLADVLAGNSGFALTQCAMPTDPKDQADALKACIDAHRKKVAIQSLPIPSWLTDLLLQLMMEWLKGRFKP